MYWCADDLEEVQKAIIKLGYIYRYFKVLKYLESLTLSNGFVPLSTTFASKNLNGHWQV
jgi:hypothetical protein